MRIRNLLLLAAVLALPSAVRADVKLHPLFTDHMVIQRDMATKIWGTADAGEKITVYLAEKSISVQFGTGTADSKGGWVVELPPKTAGTSYSLTIEGKNKITLENVAFGDVWLCSGQSNMEWKLRQLPDNKQGETVAATANHPNIRYFSVPNKPFPEPQSTIAVSKTEGFWQVCDPKIAIEFSAVAFFFGRDIEKNQKVPVGLLCSDWGGTPAQAWTSREGLKSEKVLNYYIENLDKTLEAHKDTKLVEAKYQADMENWKKAVEKAKAEGKKEPRAPQKPGPGGVTANSPTALYNGMIAPIQKFAIKGAIWYQGESNSGAAKEYRTLMPTMIQDWRKQWGQDFPFFMVQLAPFGNGKWDNVQYAELRDAQYATTKKLKNVGIAVITDVGHETDIHPQGKQPVGERLALAARNMVYGEKVEYQGPEYKSHKVEGDKVVVSFNHANGLMAKGDEVAGFMLAGEDGKFFPATAKIEGMNVVLTSDKVTKPVHVRFGWMNFAKPTLNLFNKAGLPAYPFRTDDQPLTTK
ncbi:MAG: sialate O-acetylesterase [Fimbriiglobus sp.]